MCLGGQNQGRGFWLKLHSHFLKDTPTQYPPEGRDDITVSPTIYCVTSHGCTILAHGKLGIQYLSIELSVIKGLGFQRRVFKVWQAVGICGWAGDS